MARDKSLGAHAAHVLYAAFILEKRHDIGVVARKMGIAPGTLYAYCENRESLPSYRIAQLYAATGDAKLISDLLDLGAVGLVLAEAPPALSGSGVHRAALRLGMAAGAAQAAVHEAMADGVVTPDEERTVVARIDDLQRDAATLRRVVKAV
jgi:hypothetical protein